MIVEPLTPHLGARLSGVTLAASMDDAVVSALRGVLAEHFVVVLPEQSLTPLALRDVVSRFGPLFLHHASDGVIYCEGVPEVLQMRKEPDDTRLFGGGDWHADVTF